ncbi:Cap-specific mRNA (nucleoside-2'-O-)-methyltransferase 2 [Hypsibius exemplaris]|uniref:Cap-specific mRNA (nucleoside-2'-O-)-methyltransferase 2 n=1 Tax=Hypsibius exemplaris TaxID=2072580 RepID=A0A1W0W9T8_HYPEX|nr:Cap-specific mRNA (nucleoside-2'-O-)-methyltransferase 2 [Hypsibius exemplaris]
MVDIQSEFQLLKIEDPEMEYMPPLLLPKKFSTKRSAPSDDDHDGDDAPEEIFADRFSHRKRKRIRKGDALARTDEQYTSKFWSSAGREALTAVLNQLMKSSNERLFILPACPEDDLPELIPTYGNIAHSSAESADPYLCPEMEKIEDQLNAVKGKVGSMAPAAWSSLTNYTDLASTLRYSMKKDSQIELGTNAWMKFWSILHAYPQLARFPPNTVSVHLCEAPGAFVSALNHYLSANEPLLHKSWNWIASSLNPYLDTPSDEAIVDDRFIRCTAQHWHFGADGTGNLKAAANREALVKAAASNGQTVYLVTADGGIDCSSDFAGQEATLASLKYAEAVTALRLLAPGGHFILKIFTVFRTRMCLLLRVLCSVFDQVQLYKPPTSKPGNSEVYLICLGMRRCGIAAADLLERSRESSAALGTGLSPSFIHSITEASRFFADSQSAAIRINMAVFSAVRNRRLRTCFHEAKQTFSSQFLQRHPVGQLPASTRLMFVPAVEP